MIKPNSHVFAILNKIFTLQDILSKDSYLTIYVPTHNLTKELLTKHIKLNIEEILNTKNNFKEYKTHFKNLLIDRILSNIEFSIDKLSEGLAIFVRLPFGGKEKEYKDIPEENIQTYILPFEAPQKVHLGNVFDISEILNLDTYCIHSLVIYINKNKSSIYSYHKDNFEYIHEINNNNDDDLKLKNHEKNEKIEDENKNLLLNTLNYIKEFINLSSIETILVIYSSAFSLTSLKTLFLKNIEKNIHNKSKFLFIQKSIKFRKNIKKIAYKILVAYKETQNLSMFKNIENESDSKYIKTWDKVIDAVNKKEIDTLIIRSDIFKEGFILDNNIISFNNTNNHKTIENILSWVVKSVMDISGKIIIISDKNFKDGISAKLRLVV